MFELTLVCAALAGSPVVVPWDACTWPGPKALYQPVEPGELLKVSRIARREVAAGPRKFSRNAIYYYVTNERSVEACADKRRCVRMMIPEYSYRPVSARWVDEKLLYVAITFNPHAGAYWLVDVEQENAVLAEHYLDALAEWLKCPGRAHEDGVGSRQ